MTLTTRSFFDFTVDGDPIGRVIFELFNDRVPKTAENFRALCTGENGISPLSERPLYYKSSIIHRSIKDFMIQGGDFTKRNGMGGESIYGAPFADEALDHPLDSEGLLCMANKGPNTNGSQFFITLRACPHLNGKHVVFGKVIKGYDVVLKITQVGVDEKDRPTVPVVISNCGELELVRKKDKVPKTSLEPELTDKKHNRKSRRSRSLEEDDDSESDARKHRKRKKVGKKEQSKLSELSPPTPPPPPQPVEHKETEEEYDARLEREEKERIEAARIRELERVKARMDEKHASINGGVRFKGRGRMKFVDPETQRRR